MMVALSISFSLVTSPTRQSDPLEAETDADGVVWDVETDLEVVEQEEAEVQVVDLEAGGRLAILFFSTLQAYNLSTSLLDTLSQLGFGDLT